MKIKKLIQIFIIVLVMMAQPLAWASDEETPFELKQVSGDVYCIYGKGGNIGILKTDEGLLMVDAQFKDTAPKVKKLIDGLSTKPIKYLINTHYHYDHTDGNPLFAKGAETIMHPNCLASIKKSMASQKESHGVPPYINQVTPWTEGKTIKLGDETIKLLFLGSGHTSGDLVVVFEKAKVLHMGDKFFNGMFPYIDVKDGSDTENWVNTIKDICKTYPDFKIIPGHGKVTDAAGYMKFADYLTALRKEVAAAIKAGKTKEETMNSVSLKGFDYLKELNNFMTLKNNAGWVYDEMTRKK